MGSHVIDMIYYLLGDYQKIMMKSQTVHTKRPDGKNGMKKVEADDAVYMTAELANGAVGCLQASKLATGTNDEFRVEVFGQNGSIKFNLQDPNWIEFYDNTVSDQPLGGYKGFVKIESVQRFEKPSADFPSPKVPVGWIRAHIHCLYHFLDSVYENKQPEPSMKAGHTCSL